MLVDLSSRLSINRKLVLNYPAFEWQSLSSTHLIPFDFRKCLHIEYQHNFSNINKNKHEPLNLEYLCRSYLSELSCLIP